MGLSCNELNDLTYAKTLLENPSFAAKIMNTVGIPFEKGFKALPPGWSAQIQQITEKTLNKALNFAILTMDNASQQKSADILHKIAVVASGCVGGFFGLMGMGVELPISTMLILRSVADIARSEGENISMIETKLACLEVFAFGGTSKWDDGTETGYYAIRAILSRAVSEAAAYITEHGLTEAGAPILVRLIAQISSRFGIVVSEKVAASAIPLIGSAGSALINSIFMNYFQDMARGHFIVRRLERVYGKEMVESEYHKL